MTSDTSSTPSGSAARVGLPAAVSSFVGRAGEISELSDLLERARLVTLTGAPGIGKTRLALEVAGGVVERYPDGGRLLDLAPIGDPALLPRALAGSLSVQEAPGAALLDSVIADLARRHVLLIVDNCEHLIDPCAKLVDVLLQRCPGLSILATSREPLALAGELVFHVPQLSVPPASELAVPESLMSYEAVRLFVERASAVQLAFSLEVTDAPAVAEITRRLDGIALAIELAAARLDMLTPAQIASRLDDRFALLTNGSRSHRARHQTLEAALDLSHDLLPAPERTLLRRLAVFSGGFCLEGCEAVCATGELEGEEAFHLLARLVAKSLVVAETANGPTARYRLLETIRAYAGERLEEAGEVASVRDAHARFYLDLAERAEPELSGPSQERWVARLDTEHANLRGAIQWSLAHDHGDWALRLSGALILFWRVRCYFSEGRDLLQAVIAASNGETPGLRATALWGAGLLTFMAGDPAGAQPALEESLSAFRELGDAQGAARALLILGNSGAMRDDPGALSQLEESAALAAEAGDLWCQARALAVSGYTHSAKGDLPGARPLFEQCLHAAREAQDKDGRSYGLWGLADVARIQGDYPLAASVLQEALMIARELGDDYSEASALQLLGDLAFRQGDYSKARGLLDQSLTRLPESDPIGAALNSLLFLANVAHAEGDHPGARLLIEDAMDRVRHRGTPPYALLALGRLAADEDNLDEARRLFEEALEIARAGGDHKLTGQALHELGLLARAGGDTSRAAALHTEALGLQRQYQEAPAIAASVEALGGLAGTVGRCEHAARLLGAANTLRERNRYARTPRETARYQADIALLQDGLAVAELESAVAQGAGLSMHEAVTLATKGRKRHVRPSSGWPSLTETEKQVAALAAEGLTNPQIAERMFTALATVKNHLRHIFSKLGVATRRELEREFERQREPSPPGDSESRR